MKVFCFNLNYKKEIKRNLTAELKLAALVWSNLISK
jgi:hypothetical protein